MIWLPMGIFPEERLGALTQGECPVEPFPGLFMQSRGKPPPVSSEHVTKPLRHLAHQGLQILHICAEALHFLRRVVGPFSDRPH